MTEQTERHRIHTHLTRSAFLHAEDALDIAKIRLFAGHYKRGQGAGEMTAHFVDANDARVLFSDLAWGKPVDYCEFKGSANGADGPVSRVLKVKFNNGKYWIRLETGPGEVIGQGAVKPAGTPTTVVNIPLEVWDARRLAMAVLAYLQAREIASHLQRGHDNDG